MEKSPKIKIVYEVKGRRCPNCARKIQQHRLTLSYSQARWKCKGTTFYKLPVNKPKFFTS